MSALYRLSQMWHNLTARPLSQSVLDEITVDLNPAEKSLFQKMSSSDQQHAYRVYRLLRNCGQTDGELLAAALLHDIGKIRVDLTPLDRTVAVLGENVAPKKVDEWGHGNEDGWKRAFVVREHHAAWGAALAENAGSSPGVVDLILRHQDSPLQNGCEEDERLMLLQWADNQN